MARIIGGIPTQTLNQLDLQQPTQFDFNNLAAMDDAGLEEDFYENFAPVATPGFNLPFAKQIGSGILSLVTGNPLVNLFENIQGFLTKE